MPLSTKFFEESGRPLCLCIISSAHHPVIAVVHRERGNISCSNPSNVLCLASNTSAARCESISGNQMGYELARFVEGGSSVDEELLCPICSGVLQDPVHTPQCEHAFCRDCIKKWLDRTQACPIDRFSITAQQLKPVPRILRTLLARLQLNCVFQEHGCQAILKLDRLESHEAECEHNPCRPVPCTEGCGLVVPKDELREHNCIRELRGVVQKQQAKIAELDQKLQSHWSEIIRMKEFFGTRQNGLQPPLSDGVLQERQDQLIQWSATLTQARVTRWGGMISTPDQVLQSMVKRALVDSGCPPTAIHELIENAHERKWPIGLHTLETRQRNRRTYESFVCKRIPGKQAVVVLSCDNVHMGPEMIIHPGLVMIFAHGIE